MVQITATITNACNEFSQHFPYIELSIHILQSRRPNPWGVKPITQGHMDRRREPKELDPGSLLSARRSGFQRLLPTSPPCTAVQLECKVVKVWSSDACVSVLRLFWPRPLEQSLEYQMTQNKVTHQQLEFIPHSTTEPKLIAEGTHGNSLFFCDCSLEAGMNTECARNQQQCEDADSGGISVPGKISSTQRAVGGPRRPCLEVFLDTLS